MTLNAERCKGLVVGGVTDDLFVGARVHALDRGNVERRRQVVDDCVEQWLDTLVLEG